MHAVGTIGVSTLLPLTSRSRLRHSFNFPSRLFALYFIRGLLDVFPMYQSVHHARNYFLHLRRRIRLCIHRGRCSIASTYLTKLSSSLLFALMGGEVGSSAFLPPMERAAPANVTPRVAIASCQVIVLAQVNSPRALGSFAIRTEAHDVSQAQCDCRRACWSKLFAQLPGQRTTCDPTCRPAMVYMATILAIFKWVKGCRGASGLSMDGNGEAWVDGDVGGSELRAEVLTWLSHDMAGAVADVRALTMHCRGAWM